MYSDLVNDGIVSFINVPSIKCCLTVAVDDATPLLHQHNAFQSHCVFERQRTMKYIHLYDDDDINWYFMKSLKSYLLCYNIHFIRILYHILTSIQNIPKWSSRTKENYNNSYTPRRLLPKY